MCPILPSYEFVLGDIFDTQPLDLVDKITLGEPCSTCDIRNVCGGRCLYTDKTKFWGDDGFQLICETVIHLISTIKNELPQIRNSMDKYGIKLIDFKYPVISNCVEIIP